MIKALRDFGFDSLGLKERDFLAPDQIIQFGDPPSRIEILTSLKGVDFKNCYASKVRIKFEGTRANFVRRADLRKNKRAVGRLQDLADLEHLE